MLGDVLDLLKSRETTTCDRAEMTRSVADAKGKITNMETGLLRKTFCLYDCNRRKVDEALEKVGRRLKKHLTTKRGVYN